MKPDKPRTQKRTYSRDELPLLLLTEAFERDLELFSTLVAKDTLLGGPMVQKNWTFTVTKSPTGHRRLFINVPPKK